MKLIEEMENENEDKNEDKKKQKGSGDFFLEGKKEGRERSLSLILSLGRAEGGCRLRYARSAGAEITKRYSAIRVGHIRSGETYVAGHVGGIAHTCANHLVFEDASAVCIFRCDRSAGGDGCQRRLGAC